jgi:uracil-DNA glycosylase
MMDHRKSLPMLQQQWANCTGCDLSQRRIEEGFHIVFGKGKLRSIMVIGEGPGRDEEVTGEPFSGASGKFLQRTLAALGIDKEVYVTNAVACRSYELAYNGEGQLLTRVERSTGRELPVLRDAPPKPLQIEACRARLHEQIYLVDPVLIVTLGTTPTQALLGKSVSITAVHGKTLEIEVPGAWPVPSLTQAKKEWRRKNAPVTYPNELNRVRYLVLPAFHPSYVMRLKDDRRANNPAQLFAEDMLRAAQIYDRYNYEVHGGATPIERALSENEVRDFGGDDY